MKLFIKNYLYLFFSQTISLGFNLVLSFILPKILSIENFGYWQLFLFYSSFVGFFHFGVNDGIYLRYGGKNVMKLNSELIKAQFCILFFIQFLLFLLLLFYQYFFVSKEIQWIVFWVIILMIINNLSSYITSFFQATNKLTFFSNSTIITTVSFLLEILLLYYYNFFSLYNIIFAYIFSYCITLIYTIYQIRKIFLIKLYWKNRFRYFEQYKKNTFFGFFLMISTISGMLVLGIGRYLIEKKWGIVSFALVSLALTFTTFMLFFIRQLGVVLFPFLKISTLEMQNRYYKISNKLLNLILLGLLLIIPIIYYFINQYLPKYSLSLNYFTLIFPIIVYEGKLQIILNTFMKVRRKEKSLMYINILSLIISIVFTTIGYYIESINFIILSITFATIFRGVIIELFLNKLIGIKNTKQVFIVFCISILFIFLFSFFSLYIAFILYFCIYLLFLFFNIINLKGVNK